MHPPHLYLISFLLVNLVLYQVFQVLFSICCSQYLGWSSLGTSFEFSDWVVVLAKNFLGVALDDTTSDGQVARAFKVQIDLAS